MRYALISDIHANLHALDAVLSDIDLRRDIDAIYHLGDLVGYAAFPNEIVERLKSRNISGVQGNYDSTVGTAYKHCGCKSENARQEELAHISFAFTCAAVTAETRRYLRALPYQIELRPLGGHTAGPKIVLVHGTPTLNTVYWSEDRADDFCLKIAANIGLRAGDTVAFGHTHKSWHREIEGIHFVNTGSVGRPKDGDWRAGYAVIESGVDGTRVHFSRIPYDISSAAAKILSVGLPADFADFLRTAGGQVPTTADAI